MKKTVLFLLVTTLFLGSSCQKDVVQEDVASVKSEKQEWLSASLDGKFANSQKQVTAYLFSKAEMAKLIKTPNIYEVRFVLGYAENTIQIEVTGVDKLGNSLGTVKSTVLKESNYESKLATLKVLSVDKANKRTSLLNKHLMMPKKALAMIEAWQEKLNTVSDLNEITSHEGVRYRHFSLESDIIDTMVNSSSANIGLFLGLNSKGKVTTVLINLDKKNNIKTTSLNSKEIEDVYDFSRPCPPNGIIE